MIRARAALVLDHPFFGSIALRLTLKPDPTCSDLWTDGRTLGFNPSYAAVLSEAALIGAQAHEVMHLACAHHVRREERDRELWNKACDIVVNQLLLDAGFSSLRVPCMIRHMPGFPLRPCIRSWPAFRTRLPIKVPSDRKRRRKPNKRKEAAGSRAKGKAKGKARMIPPKANAVRPNCWVDTELLKAAKTRGKGNVRSPWPLREKYVIIPYWTVARDSSKTGGTGSRQLNSSRPCNAPDIIWATCRQAFSACSGSGCTQRWTGGASFNASLENCADGDSHMGHAKRAADLYQGICLAFAGRSPVSARAALAVDSSGSVDNALLEMFCTELSGILESYDTLLTVLFHDTRVQSVQTFTRQDLPLRLAPAGGGGTDYRPVTAYIEENDLAPTCMIWFTDLECDRFPEEPAFPVLWLAEQPNGTTPPFGETG